MRVDKRDLTALCMVITSTSVRAMLYDKGKESFFDMFYSSEFVDFLNSRKSFHVWMGRLMCLCAGQVRGNGKYWYLYKVREGRVVAKKYVGANSGVDPCTVFEKTIEFFADEFDGLTV